MLIRAMMIACMVPSVRGTLACRRPVNVDLISSTVSGISRLSSSNIASATQITKAKNVIQTHKDPTMCALGSLVDIVGSRT